MVAGSGRVGILGSYAPSLVNLRGKLIEELVSRGYDVVAMAPDISDAVAQHLRSLGAMPLEVPLARNPLNPLQLLGCRRELSRIFRQLRLAAIICYTIQPATVGVLAASAARVPKIVPLVTGLGYPFGSGKGLKRRLSRLGAVALYRVGLARASVVVFQNPDDRADLEKAGGYPPGKPSVVVNGSGVDVDFFRPAAFPKRPHFLMIARLIRDKGVFEYGEAAMRLKSSYPDAIFSLAGWRDNSPGCISEQELAGIIAAGVSYLGKVADVRPAIAESSVFVLPSGYREGTPRSILEAMAMGRPIITCDVPGCRETVFEGENGFLIQPFDADQLARAMEKFIVEPGLSEPMGRRSRQIVEHKYDVRDVNRALLDAAGL